MQSSVQAGERPSFQLSEALLIYRAVGDNSSQRAAGNTAFVTRHTVKTDTKTPRIAPGELVDVDFVTNLMSSLLGDQTVEILPENVIVRTQHRLVWWTPPAIRPMFYFADRSPELAEISGKRYPQPALLFSATKGGELTVRALKEAKRPKPNTKLYIAPYWNVYDDGDVCVGSMQTPREFGLSSMEQWERAFFESEFNHQNTRKPLTTHPKGFVALWKELYGKKIFPVKYLADAGETLEKFVSKQK